MKSIEEARRQLANGEIKYRRALRATNKKTWDDYTIATQRKKHKSFVKAIDFIVDNKSYRSWRDIHILYSVQVDLHSTARQLLCEGDNEGKTYYERVIGDFSDFLGTLHLEYPLSDTRSIRSNLWKRIKAQVAEEDKERERLRLIEKYNLDKNLPLLKARIAAKKVDAKQAREEAAARVKQEREAAVQAKEAREAADAAHRERLGLNDEADLDLALKLEQRAKLAMKNAEKGYLYFKCWVLPDDSKWYKIGITNNPSRREAEQNVLPVPAHTLHIIALASTDHARHAEGAFHNVLDHEQIKGAGNRELFSLKPKQVQAVIAAMKQLENTLSTSNA